MPDTACDALCHRLATLDERSARIEGLLNELLLRLPAVEREARELDYRRTLRLRRTRMGADLNRKLGGTR